MIRLSGRVGVLVAFFFLTDPAALSWFPGDCFYAVQPPMAAWPSGTSPLCWTMVPPPWSPQRTLGFPIVSS